MLSTTKLSWNSKNEYTSAYKKRKRCNTEIAVGSTISSKKNNFNDRRGIVQLQGLGHSSSIKDEWCTDIFRTELSRNLIGVYKMNPVVNANS